ncbi:MAG: prepilin-type cleavage/methylation protein [Verrucomicrobiaceae bacterium]|nr:prepilin-type cleavage/methylation protein [Verrucomicrobiaceae bacterium]
MNAFISDARRRAFGFSLVEALLTIAIMGILSSLVVGVVSNASKDASRMMSRQQQGAVQSAVDAWVSSQMRDILTGQVRSLESIRADYNSRGTSLARFNLVAGSEVTIGYLDASTVQHFTSSTTNSASLKSDALNSAGQHLEMPTWDSSSYPKVNLVND